MDKIPTLIGCQGQVSLVKLASLDRYQMLMYQAMIQMDIKYYRIKLYHKCALFIKHLFSIINTINQFRENFCNLKCFRFNLHKPAE